MSTLRTNLLASVACAASLLSLVPEPSFAQNDPGSSGQTYPGLRESLLAKGWKPDVHYGLKTLKGKPLYRFPEVLCGPTLCNAKWRDRDGAERVISLLRGDGKEDYRVAPQ